MVLCLFNPCVRKTLDPRTFWKKEIPPAPEKNPRLLGTVMKTSWWFLRRLCSKGESASQAVIVYGQPPK